MKLTFWPSSALEKESNRFLELWPILKLVKVVVVENNGVNVAKDSEIPIKISLVKNLPNILVNWKGSWIPINVSVVKMSPMWWYPWKVSRNIKKFWTLWPKFLRFCNGSCGENVPKVLPGIEMVQSAWKGSCGGNVPVWRDGERERGGGGTLAFLMKSAHQRLWI